MFVFTSDASTTLAGSKPALTVGTKIASLFSTICRPQPAARVVAHSDRAQVAVPRLADATAYMAWRN